MLATAVRQALIHPGRAQLLVLTVRAPGKPQRQVTALVAVVESRQPQVSVFVRGRIR